MVVLIYIQYTLTHTHTLTLTLDKMIYAFTSQINDGLCFGSTKCSVSPRGAGYPK